MKCKLFPGAVVEINTVLEFLRIRKLCNNKPASSVLGPAVSQGKGQFRMPYLPYDARQTTLQPHKDAVWQKA